MNHLYPPFPVDVKLYREWLKVQAEGCQRVLNPNVFKRARLARNIKKEEARP